MFRCAIPGLNNDTYEIANENHAELVRKYIPLSSSSIKDDYDKCNFNKNISLDLSNENVLNLTKCNKWVYSKKYFEKTIVTEVIEFSSFQLREAGHLRFFGQTDKNWLKFF